MGYMLAMDAGVIQDKFFDNGETVLREAASDIDLTGIMIDKKAISGHPGTLLGSVSQKVVAQAKCPVLVVK